MESAVLLAEQSTITAAMLRLAPTSVMEAGRSHFDQRLGDVERAQLLDALRDADWNVSRAAIRLGISRNRLRYRIEKHRLNADRYEFHSDQQRMRSSEQAARTSTADPSAAAEVMDVQREPRHVALLRAELVAAPATASSDPVRAITVIADKIRSFGGQVQELAAMTVVGAFGFEPVENAPNSAALAALAIQKAAERARRVDSRAPAVKIAVHAAQLMVDRVNGVPQIKLEDRAVTKPPLATLSDAAAASSILVSAAAAPFLERRFELARQPCRGVAEPVYRLIGAERTGFGLGGRTLTRFVGRQRELALVCDRLAQAERALGQLVAVVGEPGVGKSRFLYEITRADCARGWRFLSSRAVPYGASTPLLPIVELLKSYFDIEDRDDAGRIREKAAGKLLALDRALEPHLVPLLALLDVASDDESWKPLDPAQKRLRTLDACKRLILREARLRPLALLFEDLHWIDGETQALLDSLVESLPTARLLLMVSFRPEYQVRWGSKTYYTQLRIDPLTGESAEELLRSLLGTDPSLEPLARLLIERTEGNPFYLEESVRSLVETGQLQGSRAAYRVAASPTSIQVPATVQAILAARIDRLAAQDKHVLQAAAVIGKDVPYALLHAIVTMPEALLRQRLATLQAGELLYEKSLFPNLEYTFKHALTHEVAYGSVPQEQCKTLHAHIMASIERLYGDRLSEHVARLADHALRGHLWDPAVRYSRQAGTRALDRSAPREALVHFELARVALHELPDSRERTEQRIDVCFDQRHAVQSLGEFARQGELLGEAHALAERLGDDRRLGWALGYQAGLSCLLGEYARAIEAAERACAIAEAVGDTALRFVASYHLGQAFRFAGDPRGATEPLRATISLLRSTPPGERFGLWALPGVLVRHVLAMVLAELGEFAQALDAGEEGLRIARTASHPYSEVLARGGIGYAQLRRGEFVKAIEALEPGLALCRAMEIRFSLPYLAAALGSAYLWSGRAADAVPLLEEAVEAFTAMRILGSRSLFITLLAEAYLVAGRVAEGRELAEQAVALARTHQERGWEAWGLKLLGDINAHDHVEAEQTEDAYRQSLALADALGMRPLAAECHLALGEQAKKAGEGRSAQEQFSTALSMFREMRMQVQTEKAESALKQLSALG